MLLRELTKHSKQEEIYACEELLQLLLKGFPVVYAADAPKENKDKVERQMLYFVQVRKDLNNSSVTKIQAKALGWKPNRLVRTTLNIDPKVIATFTLGEQQLYQQGAVWEGCVVRVREEFIKRNASGPKKVRDELYKVVDGKYVFENTVLAEVEDKDYIDHFYHDYDLVAAYDELAGLPDVLDMNSILKETEVGELSIV